MIDFIIALFKPKDDLAEIVKNGAVIMDVRTTGEFSAGHMTGSRNIPLDKIKKESATLKKLNKPAVTVCHSGSRSSMAKAILTSAGIEVYNGGSWTNLKRIIK